MRIIGAFCSYLKGNQEVVSNDILFIIAKDDDRKSTVTAVLKGTLRKLMLPTHSHLYNCLNFFLFTYTYIFLLTVIIKIFTFYLINFKHFPLLIFVWASGNILFGGEIDI